MQNKQLEEEEIIKETLQQLHHMIADQNIVLPDNCDCDKFLIRFLRARKFNVERALQSLKKYLNLKRKYSSLIEDASPKDFRSLYENNSSVVFSNRDSKGRKIIYICTKSWNPSEISLLRWLISIYVMIEGVILDEETQRNGISLIIDYDQLSFYQARNCSPKPIKLLMEILQDTLPVSFQEIHVVNHSMIFNFVWAIGKPFLKEKLQKRFLFHGYDMNKLHKFICPTLLPSCLGGTLSIQEASDTTFLEQFLSEDVLYKDVLPFGTGTHNGKDTISGNTPKINNSG